MPLWWFCNVQWLRPAALYERCKLALELKRLKTPDVGKVKETLENEFRSFELILQPFRHFTYVTAHSPTLPSLYLRHSAFSNHSFASPTSKALHLRHLASRPWSKTLMELIFNPCGEFMWSPEGPVIQIHSPHLHVSAPRIVSDILRSVQVLKREWDAKSNGKLPHLFIPGKTAALVPEFAVEDLPSAELQRWFLRLHWRTCPWAEHSDHDDDEYGNFKIQQNSVLVSLK